MPILSANAFHYFLFPTTEHGWYYLYTHGRAAAALPPTSFVGGACEPIRACVSKFRCPHMFENWQSFAVCFCTIPETSHEKLMYLLLWCHFMEVIPMQSLWLIFTILCWSSTILKLLLCNTIHDVNCVKFVFQMNFAVKIVYRFPQIERCIFT